MFSWNTCARILALSMVLVIASSAKAAYILTALSGGFSSVNVAPGGSFDLACVLTSTGSDEHNSATFRVVFSEPGLEYTGYTWQPRYYSDASAPLTGSFPVLLSATTFSDQPLYPEPFVDVLLTNVVDPDSLDANGEHLGMVTTGTIVTLGLRVPLDYSGSPTVTISVVPDQIYKGFTEIITAPGQDFTLTIPEPTTLAIFVLGAAATLMRRPRARRCPQVQLFRGD